MGVEVGVAVGVFVGVEVAVDVGVEVVVGVGVFVGNGVVVVVAVGMRVGVAIRLGVSVGKIAVIMCVAVWVRLRFACATAGSLGSPQLVTNTKMKSDTASQRI